MKIIKIYLILFWTFCISTYATSFPFGYYLDTQQLKMAKSVTVLFLIVMMIGTILRKINYARLAAFTLSISTIILAIIFIMILMGSSDAAVRAYVAFPVILVVNFFIIRFLLGRGYKAYVDDADTYEAPQKKNESGW